MFVASNYVHFAYSQEENRLEFRDLQYMHGYRKYVS